MNQILDEIRQDIKDEKFERLVTVHGKRILGFAAFIIVFAAAIIGFNSYKRSQNLEAGRVFYEAFSTGKVEDYQKVFETNHEGFENIARQLAAGIDASNENFDEAIKNLEEISKSSNSALSEFAQLSALKLKLENDKLSIADADKEFYELMSEDKVFRHTAAQLYISFLILNEKNDKANQLIEEILKDKTTYESLKKRLLKLREIIKA